MPRFSAEEAEEELAFHPSVTASKSSIVLEKEIKIFFKSIENLATSPSFRLRASSISLRESLGNIIEKSYMA